MSRTFQTTRVSSTPDLLGESPVWDGASDRLYWVDGVSRLIRWQDFAGGTLVRSQSGQIESEGIGSGQIETPSMVGSIGLAAPGQLVVGLADGLFRVDLATAAFEPLFRPEPHDPAVRFNDGKVDPHGRFLCGSMGVHAAPLGELVRVSAHGVVEKLARDIRISNALCFSPDGTTLYFADSLDRMIRAYAYRADDQPLPPPRVFVETRTWGSGPDGATVDTDGCVWVALVMAGKIARFTPAGALDRLIDAPTDMPSSVAFGGRDLRTLFVTSIKDSGSGRAISIHPDGGHVFAIDGLGAQGLPEPRFGQARTGLGKTGFGRTGMGSKGT